MTLYFGYYFDHRQQGGNGESNGRKNKNTSRISQKLDTRGYVEYLSIVLLNVLVRQLTFPVIGSDDSNVRTLLKCDFVNKCYSSIDVSGA